MRAVIYARYSSDNQREESIDGQLRECMEFAERNDFTVIDSYIDRALSAKTDNRPNFQRMIKDSYKNLFDVVIVWKLDRFARNRYDSAHYKNILKKNGVRIVSAKEIISQGAEGILLESLLEGYAEYYSVELAEKVKRGLTENALKAKANGGTRTFGYVVDKDRNFQIEPVAAGIVRDVFQMYADGKKIKEIIDVLVSRGVSTNYSISVSFSFIQRMLSNRRYMGEYRFGDVVIPDAIPVIVEKELFERVAVMLEKNKKAPSRHKAEDDYILTTKLFCGSCGAMMNGESGTSHTGAAYRYYKCVNARKKQCKKKPVKKDMIENAVIQAIIEFLDDNKKIDPLVGRLYQAQFNESSAIPRLQEQIQDTQKKIDNLIKAAEQGFVSESSAKRLQELEESKKQQEIKLLQEQIKKPLLTQEQIEFGIYKFKKLDLKTRKGKQKLIDSFVNAIFVYDDHIKLFCNYTDSEKIITFDELKSSSANSPSPPKIRTTQTGSPYFSSTKGLNSSATVYRQGHRARALAVRDEARARWEEKRSIGSAPPRTRPRRLFRRVGA
ncbi:MAG: recombinase family protein [Ruminococcaceae bacterium]|nr:recombinase family protein [Oscillospiraceae bacterium]